MAEGSLKGRIEAILFVAGEAVSIRDMAKALQIDEKELKAALKEIGSEYDYEQRGFMLKRFGDKVQLATRPLYSEDVLRLLQPVQQQSLSQAAMETLAVVAYKQPVTRAEVEQIRGVKCDYSLQSLMMKGLIQEAGRKDTIGRPILYATTDTFLSHFGIQGLEDLPPLPETESGTTEEEEMEANAFAGTLLAPIDDIDQQIRIFRINRSNIGMDDILTLMDIFAIPYKAMVLRLLEEEIISTERATELMNVSSEDVSKRQAITGKARRWMLVPKGHEKLGSIMENITINDEEESLPQNRLNSDLAKLQKIKERYGIE